MAAPQPALEQAQLMLEQVARPRRFPARFPRRFVSKPVPVRVPAVALTLWTRWYECPAWKPGKPMLVQVPRPEEPRASEPVERRQWPWSAGWHWAPEIAQVAVGQRAA